MLKKRPLWVAISILLVLVLFLTLVFCFVLPNMWNFLVVNEQPKASDVIIVLSGDTGRLEYGVKLFQQGYADRLLCTGGGARAMQREAIAMGIPEDDILVERRSHSTFENATNSWQMMQEQGLKTAIVVTSAYHTRRASIIFGQFIPKQDLTVCAVPDTTWTSGNWWKDRAMASTVVSEYLKLVYHYLFER